MWPLWRCVSQVSLQEITCHSDARSAITAESPVVSTSQVYLSFQAKAMLFPGRPPPNTEYRASTRKLAIFFPAQDSSHGKFLLWNSSLGWLKLNQMCLAGWGSPAQSCFLSCTYVTPKYTLCSPNSILISSSQITHCHWHTDIFIFSLSNQRNISPHLFIF